MTDSRPLAIGAATANRETCARGETVELTIDLRATYGNAFDPGDIDVVCEIRKPDGQAVTVPAFFYTPFAESADGAVGVRGTPTWKVRFTPFEVGEHSYRIKARDRTGAVESSSGRFECMPGDHPGLVRVSQRQPYAFEFDSGAPYLPVGFNVFHWAKLGQPLPADRVPVLSAYMNRLADAGGNFIRLRMDSWWLSIEEPANDVTGYLGPGWYHQRACWEIDKIYELAEKRGIQLMHCLYNANGLVNPAVMSANKRNRWRRAYAFCLKENGGPCDTVEEFWTNAEMRNLVRRKLRYAVARWGYNPNLMCWEFWNELVLDEKLIDEQVSWHRDMARHLRSLDPWRHPISSSLMSKGFDKQEPFWQLPEMEIVQVHSYRGSELPNYMAGIVEESARRWRKPFFFGEYGIIHEDGTQGKYPYDPGGVHLHNGLWSPVMAGAGGAGAFWFVSGYLDQHDLYYHYRALADWVKGVPWTDPAMHPLASAEIAPAAPGSDFPLTDGPVAAGTGDPFRQAAETRFVVSPDGSVTNREHLQPMLHMRDGERKTKPVFVLDCADPATFVVHVRMSVGNAGNRFVAYLDGGKAVERAFPAGKGYGTSSNYIEQYDNWRTAYDERVEIDVPAGQHEIMLEAFGKDRLDVEYYLKHYFRPAPLVVSGRRTDSAAWFWVRDCNSVAYRLRDGVQLRPVENMRVTLADFADGDYDVQWWDTWRAKVVATDSARANNGRVVLDIPPVFRDIAASLRRRK